MSTSAARTWFITGASRGLGAQWVRAVLDRGDRVAATSRRATSLQPLVERYGDRVLPLAFDVADADAVGDAVHRAEDRFGGIDVLVNNAGHALLGTVEEVGADQARTQFDVNYFGPLWTSRAVLPGMRARGGGRIIQISSFGGLVSFPTMGLYHSSKWALEAVSEALAAEVAPFGIHVTIVEPLTFPTDLGATAPEVAVDPAYDGVRAALVAQMRDSPFIPGDPAATSAALLAIADAPEPPLRVLFGSPGFEVLSETYAQRLAGIEHWLDIAQLAQGTATPPRAETSRRADVQ